MPALSLAPMLLLVPELASWPLQDGLAVFNSASGSSSTSDSGSSSTSDSGSRSDRGSDSSSDSGRAGRDTR